MEISVNEITAWVGDFFWPFIRVSAVFLASPIFGARTIPVRIRIILSVLVTLVVQPSLPFLPAIDPLSTDGMMIIIQQLAIGIVMGLILQIIFGALVMAGQVIATTMGLGFASAVDPQNGVQVTMLGQIYLIIATLLFLAIDGHLVLIEILVTSFSAMPINTSFISIDIFWSLAMFSGQIFVSALLLAFPIMVGVLLVNLGFGVMTRAAPQLNIFAVGFPITMMAGFTLMLLSLPVLVPIMKDFFATSLDFMTVMFN